VILLRDDVTKEIIDRIQMYTHAIHVQQQIIFGIDPQEDDDNNTRLTRHREMAEMLFAKLEGLKDFADEQNIEYEDDI
jgi:hypothetical protein